MSYDDVLYTDSSGNSVTQATNLDNLNYVHLYGTPSNLSTTELREYVNDEMSNDDSFIRRAYLSLFHENPDSGDWSRSGFLSSFKTVILSQNFTDWDSFISAWRKEVGSDENDEFANTPGVWDASRREGFVYLFTVDSSSTYDNADPNKFLYGINHAVNINTGQGDLELGIGDPTIEGNLDTPFNTISDSNKDIFNRAFSYFIQSYEPPQSTQGLENIDYFADFIDKWGRFSSQSAWIMKAANTSNPFDPELTLNPLITYQEIYNAFFPEGTADSFLPAETTTNNKFEDRVKQFYDELLANGDTGEYFVPSHFIKKFFEDVQAEYLALVNQDVIPIGYDALDNDSEKAQILNDLFAILVEMIETVQIVAATQAKRLSFLTEWQAAYTNLMAQVPVYVNSGVKEGDADDSDAKPLVPYIEEEDTGGSSSTTDEEGEARTEINTTLNATYLENLKAYRSLIGDDAKQIQSQVNQANDAVTSQAGLATSILQQLSTILQALFR